MATPHPTSGTHLPQAAPLCFPLEQRGFCDLAQMVTGNQKCHPGKRSHEESTAGGSVWRSKCVFHRPYRGYGAKAKVIHTQSQIQKAKRRRTEVQEIEWAWKGKSLQTVLSLRKWNRNRSVFVCTLARMVWFCLPPSLGNQLLLLSPEWLFLTFCRPVMNVMNVSPVSQKGHVPPKWG